MSIQKDTLTLNAGLNLINQAKNNLQLIYPASDYWASRLSYNGFKSIILKDNNNRFEPIIYKCLGIEKDYSNGKWNFIIKLA